MNAPQPVPIGSAVPVSQLPRRCRDRAGAARPGRRRARPRARRRSNPRGPPGRSAPSRPGSRPQRAPRSACPRRTPPVRCSRHAREHHIAAGPALLPPPAMRTCVRSMYAELHAHSAFSFLDGASLPEELAGAAAEAGYSAFALTDHNGLSGSMEFAQAAKGLGVKAIHGAEVDLDDGRHLTLLVETQEGWRSLCRILTRAHAHARDHGEPPPAVPLEMLEEHAAGLVCLSGCARQGVHDEPTLRRLLAAFGRENLRVELQRPFQRDDRARNRRLAGLGRAARRGGGGDRRRPRARARARATAGRVRRPAQPLDARCIRAAAPRQHRPRAGFPRGDGGALRGPPAGGGRGVRARRPVALRPHGRSRLPLPGRGGRDRDPLAGRAVLGADRRALPRRQPASSRPRTPGSRRSCA